MKKDIDLLAAAGKPEKEFEFQPLIRVFTTVLIIIYILVLAGVFSYYFYLSQKENRVADEVSRKEKQIKRLTRIESLQATVKSRTQALNWIFEREEDRIGLAESLERLKELTDERVVIKSLQVFDFGSTVSLSGSVSQVTDLIHFFEQFFVNPRARKNIENLTVGRLTKNKAGYSFTITLIFSQ